MVANLNILPMLMEDLHHNKVTTNKALLLNKCNINNNLPQRAPAVDKVVSVVVWQLSVVVVLWKRVVSYVLIAPNVAKATAKPLASNTPIFTTLPASMSASCSIPLDEFQHLPHITVRLTRPREPVDGLILAYNHLPSTASQQHNTLESFRDPSCSSLPIIPPCP